jgi:thioredoxin reductase (NADPH)
VSESYDVIIVGGGPAGLAAGLYCMRSGLKTVLIEKGLLGGQLAISKEVENYPGIEGGMGFDLAEKMAHHARSFGLEVLQKEALSVTAGTGLHTVRLADNEAHEAVCLILALGGTARKLGVPGEAEYFGSGVSYCATCDGFFFRDKIVAVVGGGDSAVEEAIHLARLVKKAYLIHRRDALRAGKMLQQRLRAEPKIELVWNTVVREIKGRDRSVSSLALENTESGQTTDLDVDGVFIRAGYYPNNQLIPDAIRMNERGFVITDEKCETSVPGIFAVGDLRQKYANQIVVAAADGAIAALAAAHFVEARKAGPPSE